MRLVEVARRGDPAGLLQSIDWPASGVSALVRALWQIDPADRPRLATRGLDNLLTEGSTAPMPLGSLALFLTQNFQIRPATMVEMDLIRAALQTPGLPPEVTVQQAGQIRDLAYRTAALDEIWVLESDDGHLAALAAGPALNGVAVVRRLPGFKGTTERTTQGGSGQALA
jgi:hypothetical protein